MAFQKFYSCLSTNRKQGCSSIYFSGIAYCLGCLNTTIQIKYRCVSLSRPLINRHFTLILKYFSNIDYIPTFHIQPQVTSFRSFISCRKCYYRFSVVLLLGNIFSQSETGLYNLKEYVNVGHSQCFGFYFAKAGTL